MERSLLAVLAGTFTLRFSTGLTGAMLSAYLAKLPEHGGQEVSAGTLAVLHASFYVAELVLSPLFGVISDRLGHHRVMLFGPAFGAVAVILTGLTTNLVLLGGTRLLEGASTAASVPSILGYIAAVTVGNELLRGKAAARFEGVTLAGIGAAFAVAPLLFAALGPAAFFLNAAFYGVSYLIYRFWVADHDAQERAAIKAANRRRVDLGRYRVLLRTSHVWLLAPTWIAVNASIGLWFSQSIFQFSKTDPRFPDQALLQGFSPVQISLAAVVIGIVFAVGLIYWATGSPGCVGPRSSCTGSLAGPSWSGAGWPSIMAEVCRRSCPWPGCSPPCSVCSCWPGPPRRRSACWPTSPSVSQPIGARSWVSTACSSRSGRSRGH